MTDEQRLNIRQAVEASGVPERTLYDWMASGLLPFVVQGRSKRMRLSDILDVKEMLEERRSGRSS